MSGQSSGITLEALAERLGALERENERMRSENAELRSKVATLEGPVTRRTEVPALRGADKHRDMESPSEASEHEVSAFEQQFSRRRLLSKAAAAAVGTVAAGALLARDAGVARADHGFTNMINAGRINVDIVRAANSNADITLLATARHTAIWAKSNRLDEGGTGVFGTSAGLGRGVWGLCDKGLGVYGKGQTGVLGEASGLFGPGVSGQNPNAVGVSGKGKIGVVGQSSEPGAPGVYAQHIGPGGIGVRGDANNDGYGGLFRGGKAQLRLLPAASAGRPTTGTHNVGELFMDSGGALFICTAQGTPGTWRRVTTTAT